MSDITPQQWKEFKKQKTTEALLCDVGGYQPIEGQTVKPEDLNIKLTDNKGRPVIEITHIPTQRRNMKICGIDTGFSGAIAILDDGNIHTLIFT